MPLAPPAARAADRRALTRTVLAAAAVLALVAVAGCADDDSDTTATPTAATPAAGALPEGFTTVSIELALAGRSQPVACCVFLADSTDERSRGLIDVTDLGSAVGMLFAYPDEQTTRFYMFDTPMPLSIAFFDGDGRFVSATDMAPCGSDDSAACPRYEAAAAFRYALEVPQGELDELGIGDGTTLEVVPDTERDSCPT